MCNRNLCLVSKLNIGKKKRKNCKIIKTPKCKTNHLVLK